jgi:hypothetical protein
MEGTKMTEREIPNPDPVTSWVLVARNLMGAYGVFGSEKDAWDFARRQNLPLDRMDTVPLVTTYMHKLSSMWWRSAKSEE